MPAPNITHLLLKFDLDSPIERTMLQPKFHYSCLKVILDQLERIFKPDANALLHEFGFQVKYLLIIDSDMSSSTHREACQSIISKLFGLGNSDDSIAPGSPKIAGAKMISKNKAEDILSNPATTEKGGLYYYSERGDRLIDMTAFCDKLW
nr:nuclear pore complex protein NUP205 [Ipomoea batatas]